MYTLAGKKKLLRDYFSKRPDISMAFIFGSYAKGTAISESDLDIGVYFRPDGREIEWEADKDYADESKIWSDVENIVKKNVDFLVLNRAFSTIAFEVLRTGMPIVIKDRLLYLKFLSRVSFEAIDFMDLIDDYWAIEQRSSSLSKVDRQRLIKLTKFLELELGEQTFFSSLDFNTYQFDSHKRRDVERWIENIANCSIDIAKILLASEKKRIPDNYQDMVKSLFWLLKFDEATAFRLADFTKLRNVLAHEYLDIRFTQIQKFIREAEPSYRKLIDFVKDILNRYESAK